MQSQRLKFTNADGLALSAVLELPAGTPRAYALFAHCFTCSKNLNAVRHIVEPLRSAGIAVLRFDFTGLGASEGDFSETSFSSNVSDLLAAAAHMSSLSVGHDGTPTLLIGHSLGGTAVLQAAQALPAVRAVATIGAPAAPAHVKHLLSAGREAIERDGSADIDLGGRTFRIRREFLDDLEQHDVVGRMAELRKALLVLHAPNDTTVDVGNATELFVAAKHPKSFVSLDDADHLLTRPADSSYAGRVIAAWADRYLTPTVEAATEPAGLIGAPGETVARTAQGGFRTAVLASGHPLTVDEPAAVGGTNQGPTPYDLLAAALASCTTMTLEMYAQRKGLDLKSSTVRVTHQKIHAADCAECETKTGKVDEFRRLLSFEGELSTAERERLVEIADRCPVHRTLHSGQGGVQVVTTQVNKSE